MAERKKEERRGEERREEWECAGKKGMDERDHRSKKTLRESKLPGSKMYLLFTNDCLSASLADSGQIWSKFATKKKRKKVDSFRAFATVDLSNSLMNNQIKCPSSFPFPFPMMQRI